MNEEKTTISIPLPLYNKLKEKIKNTDFNSVSDYAVYVFTELMADEESEENFTKDDEEKIKSRLRSLGYLD